MLFGWKLENSAENNNFDKSKEKSTLEIIVKNLKKNISVIVRIRNRTERLRTLMSYPLFHSIPDFCQNNMKIYGKAEIQTQSYCLGNLCLNPAAKTLHYK